MAKAIIMRTNGRVEDFTVLDYRDMQAAVGGMFCTVISSEHRGVKHTETDAMYTMYGNDEAKICSSGETIGMPLNISAMLFVAHVLGKELNELCTLHGDFLIVGDETEEDDGEDMQDIHEEVAQLARHFCMWQEPQLSITTFEPVDKMKGKSDAK
tara:strand:- start:18772 stop:19236 length:465 start_codon:yes stop_codon:yes gene_type:complete